MVERAAAQLNQPLEAVLVDGGYYSGRALQHAEAQGYDLYLPIPDQARAPNERFERGAFSYDGSSDSYRCPAGERLRFKRTRERNGVVTRIYRASSRSCGSCQYHKQCTKRSARELHISGVSCLEQRMRDKLSSEQGRQCYAQRNQLAEPVFGNLKFNLGFDRFHLRTLAKVDGEFLLMCLAHNVRKLAARLPGWHPAAQVVIRRLLQVYFWSKELIQAFPELTRRKGWRFHATTTTS